MLYGNDRARTGTEPVTRCISNTSVSIRTVGLSQESLTCVLDSAHDCLESSNEARAHDGSRCLVERDQTPSDTRRAPGRARQSPRWRRPEYRAPHDVARPPIEGASHTT